MVFQDYQLPMITMLKFKLFPMQTASLLLWVTSGKEFCTTLCFTYTLGLLAVLVSVRSAVIDLQPNLYNLVFTQDWKSKQKTVYALSSSFW
jgi:hypothetical protein